MANFQWVIPQGAMLTELAIDGLTVPTEGFIPYADLTQEIVEGWLNAGTDVPALDAELAIQLDNIINPKTVVLPNPF